MNKHRYNNVQLDGLATNLMQQMPRASQADAGGTGNEEQLPMWPSERIAPGGSGAFHAPKVEYSKETADLLKRK